MIYLIKIIARREMGGGEAIQVGQKPGWTRSPHNLMLISSDSLKNLIWSLFCNAGRPTDVLQLAASH